MILVMRSPGCDKIRSGDDASSLRYEYSAISIGLRERSVVLVERSLARAADYSNCVGNHGT